MNNKLVETQLEILLNIMIIIVSILFFNKYCIDYITSENFSNVEIKKEYNPEENDIAVVLTTAVEPTTMKQDLASRDELDQEIKKRINIYSNVINKYLNNTNINIFIIESTGNSLIGEKYKDNKRISFQTFNKKDNRFFYNIDNNSTSSYEAYSLLKAYQIFGLHKYNKILKITGRYYVPNIEKILDEMQDSPDIYVQYLYHEDLVHQRSEVFGMKSYLCPGIMIGVIKNQRLIEEYIFDLYFKHSKNQDPPYIAQRLPKITLEKPVQRGGDKKWIKYL